VGRKSAEAHSLSVRVNRTERRRSRADAPAKSSKKPYDCAAMPVTAHPMSTRRKPPRKAPLPRKFLRFVKNCRVALGPMVNATPLRNNTWAEGSTPRVSGEERRVKAGSESERKWARTLPMASIAESNRNSTPSSRKSTPTAVSPMPISATFCEKSAHSTLRTQCLSKRAHAARRGTHARTHFFCRLGSSWLRVACVRVRAVCERRLGLWVPWRSAVRGGTRPDQRVVRGEEASGSTAAQQRSSAAAHLGSQEHRKAHCSTNRRSFTTAQPRSVRRTHGLRTGAWWYCTHMYDLNVVGRSNAARRNTHSSRPLASPLPGPSPPKPNTPSPCSSGCGLRRHGGCAGGRRKRPDAHRACWSAQPHPRSRPGRQLGRTARESGHGWPGEGSPGCGRGACTCCLGRVQGALALCLSPPCAAAPASHARTLRTGGGYYA